MTNRKYTWFIQRQSIQTACLLLLQSKFIPVPEEEVTGYMEGYMASINLEEEFKLADHLAGNVALAIFLSNL